MKPDIANSKPDASNTNTSGTGERESRLRGRLRGPRPEYDPAFDWQSWLNERLPRVRSEVEQIMGRQP